MGKVRYLICTLFFLFSSVGQADESDVVIHRPPPANIDVLINYSDIIIVGTFGEIVDSGEFYGYGDDAEWLAEKDKETFFRIGMPKIDIPIHIREVIKGDSKFNESQDISQVTFRYFEELESALLPAAIEDRAGEKIFFLGRNPDDQTYGIGTTASIIHLDDLENGLSYNEPHGLRLRGKREKAPFVSDSTSAQEFLIEIRERVSQLETR